MLIFIVSSISTGIFYPVDSLASSDKKYTFNDVRKDPSVIYKIAKKKELESRELQKRDSDGDGLNDFFERDAMLNYKSKDTNNNTIADSKEDFDQDGFTNLDEQKYRTNPHKKDTDGDGLMDQEEVMTYHTDPVKNDTNGNGIRDGIDKKGWGKDFKSTQKEGVYQYILPKNKWNITGHAEGSGYLPEKLQLRETPILMLRELDAKMKFDIMSTDRSINFKISLPVKAAKGEKPVLYRYRYQGVKKDREIKLEAVKDQRYDSKNKMIYATFLGGDSFVVLSNSHQKIDNNLVTLPKKALKDIKDNIYIKGAPGLKIPNKHIDSTNGVVTFKQKRYDSKQKKDIYVQSKYTINRVEGFSTDTFLTLGSSTSETGLPYVILIHGYTGNSTTFGYSNKWGNANLNDTIAVAEENILSNQTYSKNTYTAGAEIPYSEPDVHYITGNVDSSNVGVYLQNDLTNSVNYTPNVDLFLFEYDDDSRDIYVNAEQLGQYIKNLKSDKYKLLPENANLAVVGHSMGGLVSRYFIENVDEYDYKYEIDRLITVATPHFGGDRSEAIWDSDLDRAESCLWNNTGAVEGCHPLDGKSPYTKYHFIAGSNDSENGSGVDSVPPMVSLKYDGYHSYLHYYTTNSMWTKEFGGQSSLGDSVVSLDSALGSDELYKGTGGPQPPVETYRSSLIYSDVIGLYHSSMMSDKNLKENVYYSLYDASATYLERIDGANRYTVSANISKKMYPSGTRNVVLARGDLFPDALSGGPLASVKNAPLLLTTPNTLPIEIKNEILRLKATHATLLGSTGAISTQVENELKNLGLTTIRMDGPNRFAVSAKIGQEVWDSTGSSAYKKAFVVTGLDFPDGLVSASPASLTKSPLLLVHNDYVPAEIENLIKTKGIKQFVVVGAVAESSAVVNKLASYGKVEKVTGSSRYETSVNMFRYMNSKRTTDPTILPFNNAKYVFALGTNFPDALSAGPFAAAQHGSIMLTPTAQLDDHVYNLVDMFRPLISYIVGGTDVVSTNVEEELRCYMSYCDRD